MPVRTVVESGPKGKRVAAFAVDWPGWSRGARTADEGLELLESYRERYRPIAVAAGLGKDFDEAGRLELVEERFGPGSVDFWGISFSPSSIETEPVDPADLERTIALLQCCWAYLDEVASRVSPAMRKGPRGGGRDRDEIVRHVQRVESLDFAKRVGLRLTEDEVPTGADVRTYRDRYVAAMRAYNAGDVPRMGGRQGWNLPFLIRHTAFHTMDHAWEMTDKDLTTSE
jgi:hypothetical protein